MSAEEKEAFSKQDAYVEEFEKAMDEDFNTADAIAAIFELVKYAIPLRQQKAQRNISWDYWTES